MPNKNKPIVAAVSPAKIALTAGETVSFCRCGLSSAQPLCDGSHRTTDLTPIRYTPEKTEDAWFCRCKQSKNLPFCDGTHKTLTAEQIGTSV